MCNWSPQRETKRETARVLSAAVPPGGASGRPGLGCVNPCCSCPSRSILLFQSSQGHCLNNDTRLCTGAPRAACCGSRGPRAAPNPTRVQQARPEAFCRGAMRGRRQPLLLPARPRWGSGASRKERRLERRTAALSACACALPAGPPRYFGCCGDPKLWCHFFDFTPPGIPGACPQPSLCLPVPQASWCCGCTRSCVAVRRVHGSCAACGERCHATLNFAPPRCAGLRRGRAAVLPPSLRPGRQLHLQLTHPGLR